jgi:hypothetical protein
VQFYPANVIPLFTSGTGVGGGSSAPQIRFFDVYYTEAPIVGLQVIGFEGDI